MCGYRVFEMWLVRLRKWTLNFVLFANLILNLSGHTWLTAAVLHNVQLWAWCWPACDAPRGLSRLLLPWVGSSGNVIKATWDHCFPCHCPVTQLCLTLCDPMDCNTPGFPVLHYLLELAQIHVHWVGDAIQPSHPLSPPSPPVLIFPSISIFSKELDFPWGDIKRQLNPNHDAVKSHMTARAASTPRFSASCFFSQAGEWSPPTTRHQTDIADIHILSEMP